MMTTIQELIARWGTDEGKPYKGSLIDMDAYGDAPDDIGCMCAQGQVLHLVGGWDADRLDGESQATADAETAKLLNISRAHAVLLRTVNDQSEGAPAVVLTDPEKVLGGQWSKLLDFWCHLDRMTGEQWAAAGAAAGDAERAAAGDAARAAAGDAAWDAAWAAAWDAERAAAGDAARAAAGDAAWDAAWAAAWAAARAAAGDAAWAAAWDAARAAAWAAAWASNEIQGTDILRANGTPLFFLPAFGFSSTDDIPARDADYGIVKTEVTK